MPHDVLLDIADEMNESGTDWERRGRAYRGFLRITRAGMDLDIETEATGELKPSDFYKMYVELRESINDILKEVG